MKELKTTTSEAITLTVTRSELFMLKEALLQSHNAVIAVNRNISDTSYMKLYDAIVKILK